MRRKKASKRGRLVSILLAGSIGYLLGAWHTTAMQRSAGLSPAQMVALRFPEDADRVAAAAPVNDAPGAPAGVARAAGANVLGNAKLALLSPEPLVPPMASPAVPQAPVQAAVPEPAVPPPSTAPVPLPHPRAAALPPAAEARSWAAPGRRRAERPGFVLNDAQIARIKRRLHLTPDQERMWPAVEAALRNIAYARAHDLDRRGAQASGTDVASLDPDGAEVQDLKSAAVPLIMSFSDEQKDEVRSLAHVMGLDNLTSEF